MQLAGRKRACEPHIKKKNPGICFLFVFHSNCSFNSIIRLFKSGNNDPLMMGGFIFIETSVSELFAKLDATDLWHI